MAKREPEKGEQAEKEPEEAQEKALEPVTPEEFYAAGGMKALLKAAGVTPQAAFREIEQILREIPPLPADAEVFRVFDATKGPGRTGRGDVGPVLALMGLTKADLPPGTQPWAERNNQLIITLSNGRKVVWTR